jgi:HEAT repeat protein
MSPRSTERDSRSRRATPRALLRACACALAIAAPHAAFAQEPMSKEPPKPKSATAIVYLTAWPKPDNKDALLTDIERLVKVRTPEMGVQARQALIADGTAAVPFLLDRYGKEKDPDVLRRLREVLVENTKADQTRLLAKHFDKPAVLERTFALWRAAAFPDKELGPAAEAAFARVEKQGAKADPEERYAAALCLTSTGSQKALDNLYDTALNEWGKRGVELRAALNGIRSPEASKKICEKLKDADRKQKVAAMHMLSGCGVKEDALYLRPSLDDDDNSIRVAAINALRGMVDGDLPVEQLSVFEAIEMAKTWKSKI